MKNNLKILISIIFILLVFSCIYSVNDDNNDDNNKNHHNNNFIQYRSFYMGFTPWPYEATVEAVDWVYDKITSEGDIISHHMEQGVPWPEAYAGDPFPQSFIDEIQSRLLRKVAGQKVLLQISPLNGERNGMALYRSNTKENDDLPVGWIGLNLDDAKVKTAFLNYAIRMIEYFNPDYVIIGVESNLLIRNNPGIWNNYIELQKYVYIELKKLYPLLELSVSVDCVSYFPEWTNNTNLQAQLDGLNDLNPYIDFLSFSVHPFMSALLADNFPVDYFQRLFSITSKPVAISESSYPAQYWQTMTAPILNFYGTQEKQNNFLSLMLYEAQCYKSKFVIWFSIRDYDALWNDFPLKVQEQAIVWRDTGLYDEAGNIRLSLLTWQKWYYSYYLP